MLTILLISLSCLKQDALFMSGGTPFVLFEEHMYVRTFILYRSLVLWTCVQYTIYTCLYIFQNVETNRLIFLQTIRQSSNRQETWGPILIKQTNNKQNKWDRNRFCHKQAKKGESSGYRWNIGGTIKNSET